MVSVVAYKKNSAGDWFPNKTVECSDKEAQGYVKMFFDMGYDKVRVD